MARDQEPMTEEQIEAFRETLEEQREDIRAALAEELGGEPDDYCADSVTADGGN